ncbi:MAG: hypothetical protein AB2A00_36295 [Myxococcota bacterium]
MVTRSRPLVALGLLLGMVSCAAPEVDPDKPGLSPEGRAVLRLHQRIKDSFGADVRSATVLDGINVNVLKLDIRTDDKTLPDRVKRAQEVARFLAEQDALPRNAFRLVFDFPVSFQLGCMPVSFYERVQLETRGFTPVQVLPAQRVLSYDQAIVGEMGKVVLDDAVWNIPFFATVDQVEVSREVMGVQARPDEVFVSVHAVWTNIGTGTATMSDDPWRLVEGAGPKKGELVAILDGGNTHVARNGGHIKVPPVEPGKSQERWYVYRVPTARLAAGPLAFARQRFAKQNAKEKEWQKAGFELWVQIKNGHGAVEPTVGQPVIFESDDWRTPVTKAGPQASPPPESTVAPH